jgi:hypothetical protein
LWILSNISEEAWIVIFKFIGVVIDAATLALIGVSISGDWTNFWAYFFVLPIGLCIFGVALVVVIDIVRGLSGWMANRRRTMRGRREHDAREAAELERRRQIAIRDFFEMRDELSDRPGPAVGMAGPSARQPAGKRR